MAAGETEKEEVEEVPKECIICHDTKGSLICCAICKGKLAHATCLEKGKLYTIYNEKYKAYFCGECKESKSEAVNKMISEKSQKLAAKPQTPLAADDKQNSQNPPTRAFSSLTLGTKAKTTKTVENVASPAHTPEIGDFFSQNARLQRDVGFDENLELEKRKKALEDAYVQVEETKGKYFNANTKLQLASDDLVTFQKKFPETNGPDSRQTQGQVLTSTVMRCNLCRHDIQSDHQILRCVRCKDAVHYKCGLVDLQLRVIKTQDNRSYKCCKCVINEIHDKSLNDHNEGPGHSTLHATNLEDIQLPVEMANSPNERERFSNIPYNDNPNITIAENMQRSMDERNFEKLKKELKTLPVVTDTGLTWKNFYNAYKDSKHYFKPYINAQRIRDAIQCKEIKEQGGDSLFQPESCDATIDFLNELYSDTTSYMLKKLTDLLSTRISNWHDYDQVLKYLINALNFTTLQNSIGNPNAACNIEWITRIADKLPFEHKTAWHQLCYEKKKQRLPETFKDLELFLRDRIAYVNMVKRDHMFFKSSDVTDKKSNKPPVNRSQKSFNNTQSKKEAWDYRCWVCGKDDHIVRDCRIVKEKDGKEIFILASKLKICIACGREKYVPGQPCSSQKSPSECRNCPGKRHWLTVCPRRKGKKITKSADTASHSQKDNRNKGYNNNHVEESPTQQAMQYPQHDSLPIDYHQRPMLMPPPTQNNNNHSQNDPDYGAEFVAHNSNYSLNLRENSWQQGNNKRFNMNRGSLMHNSSKKSSEI